MWTVRVEAMTETGEQRLWKVAVYKDGQFMNNHLEGLTHEEATVVAKELEPKLND